MSENTQKAQKKNWFKGIKAEFNKIIWPDRMTVAKETIAVVATSVVLGAVIAIVDFIAQYGVDLLVK
jgi:preprotein translocase subunit SecE